MAENCVTPYREREFRKDGTFKKFTDPPRYRVDGDEIPGLVARGVMPFRFLRMRSDFATRFAGCEVADDVRRVLSAEGYYCR